MTPFSTRTVFSWKQIDSIVSRSAEKNEIDVISIPFLGSIVSLDSSATPLKDLADMLEKETGRSREYVTQSWGYAVDLAISSRTASGETGMPAIKGIVSRWVSRLVGDVRTDEELSSLVEQLLTYLTTTWAKNCTIDANAYATLKHWRSKGLKICFLDDTYMSAEQLQSICRFLDLHDIYDFCETTSDLPNAEILNDWLADAGLAKVLSVRLADLTVRDWTLQTSRVINLLIPRKALHMHRSLNTRSNNLSLVNHGRTQFPVALIKTLFSHPVMRPYYNTIKRFWRR